MARNVIHVLLMSFFFNIHLQIQDNFYALKSCKFFWGFFENLIFVIVFVSKVCYLFNYCDFVNNIIVSGRKREQRK